jgi:RNA polymerase sigma factor (sigma-70 family)
VTCAPDPRPLAEVVTDLAAAWDRARRRLWTAVGLLAAEDADPGELRTEDDDFHLSRPLATTPEAEQLLATAIEARADLVASNVGLVRAMVRGRPDARELAAAGHLALYKSADRFDPRRGAHFATCARWWIRKAIRASERARGPMAVTEHAARTGKAPRIAGPDAALQRPDDAPDPERAALEAEEAAAQAHRLDRLRHALDTLDPQVRRLVLADAAGEDVAPDDRRLVAAGRRALATALGLDPSLPRRATHRGSARPAMQGDLFALA